MALPEGQNARTPEICDVCSRRGFHKVRNINETGPFYRIDTLQSYLNSDEIQCDTRETEIQRKKD